MSFMPSPPAVVRLNDGRVGVMDTVTPNGRGDKVLIEEVDWDKETKTFKTVKAYLIPITSNDIHDIIWEP